MNRNLKFDYDLDYSKDKNIDKRILEVCAIAEAQYLQNQKNKKSYDIQNNEININDLIISNDNDNNQSNNVYNDIKRTVETSNSNVQNKSFFTASKIGRIKNKSIDLENNLLSQRFYSNKLKNSNNNNSSNNNYIKMNMINNNNKNNNKFNNDIFITKSPTQNSQNIKFLSNFNFPTNLKNNINTNNNNTHFNNNINSPTNINNDTNTNLINYDYNNNFINNFSKSQNNFYVNNMKSGKRSNTPMNSYNNKISFNNKNEKSNNLIESNELIQKNYKPLFSKSIDKNYIFPHDKHIQYKNKFELNKILLEAQSLIKNHKYMSAYYLLKEIISTGEYHSDLFYLYGDVNRILQNYKVAEDYLLLALNFEIHSPYVFYSMGLLYHRLNKYDYSNIFLKLFKRLINNSKVHYFIAKNYMLMGEFLKAAKEITIAIEMNKEFDYYYKMRSEIYNKIGLNEMSKNDLEMYNYIRNIKTEENI